VNDDRLLTAAEIAELLTVPERWVREHTPADRIDCKLGWSGLGKEPSALPKVRAVTAHAPSLSQEVSQSG
jgi:hypothetical protein